MAKFIDQALLKCININNLLPRNVNKNYEKKLKVRRKVGKFLKDNFITITIYIFLVCVGIWDSAIALIVYSAVMSVICLYCPELIENKGNSGTLRTILYKIAEAVGIMTVLAMTGHWNALCVSVFYVFLSFVHLYDMRIEKIAADEIQNVINRGLAKKETKGYS